jgi:exonuclease III
MLTILNDMNADILCLQETKLSNETKLPKDMLVNLPGWESFWSFNKVRKGQAGVVTFVKKGLTVSAREGWEGMEKRFLDEGTIHKVVL